MSNWLSAIAAVQWASSLISSLLPSAEHVRGAVSGNPLNGAVRWAVILPLSSARTLHGWVAHKRIGPEAVLPDIRYFTGAPSFQPLIPRNEATRATKSPIGLFQLDHTWYTYGDHATYAVQLHVGLQCVVYIAWKWKTSFLAAITLWKQGWTGSLK